VGNWVELKLEGVKSNRDAIGSRVTLKAGGQTMIREVNGGNGYSGQSTLRLHFGLGPATKIDSLEIRWPSGATQKETVAVNKITRIREK
jgi:enediyne biosynthesis protein E4